MFRWGLKEVTGAGSEGPAAVKAPRIRVMNDWQEVLSVGHVRFWFLSQHIPQIGNQNNVTKQLTAVQDWADSLSSDEAVVSHRSSRLILDLLCFSPVTADKSSDASELHGEISRSLKDVFCWILVTAETFYFVWSFRVKNVDVFKSF